SPTSIKLHWTCKPPKSCQGSWKIRAQCLMDGPLSGPCWRPQHTTSEQPLQGLEGTVTCSSLHPFTSYRVTISGGYPATDLYSQLVHTSETAEHHGQERVQQNVRVRHSVTKSLLPPLRHVTTYTVPIQGLTAAGLGQESRWDFETNISEPAIPPSVTALSVYSISPSSGTALLPLQPLPGLHGPIREYQIIVSAMQNGSEADTCCSPGLQPFNSSLERDMYLAAVLPAHNLTGPTDFVLGDGAHHYGYYNAPLRPHRNYTAVVRVVSRWNQKLVSGLLHPSHAGKEPWNQAKNRYKSVIPCPLPGTVVDFWQMIWQEKVSAIVMLTGLVEQNKTKCEQYWPEGEQVCGDFTVTLSNTWTTTSLVTRTFRLQRAGSPLPRNMQQFHYLLWPDHGVPSNPARLLQLVEMVNERVSEAPAGPVLVHCSAGIGRTGTFIALDVLLKMARAEGSVDVFRCVQRLREQRVSMVQTKEQYTFLYEVLLEGLLCGNTGVLVESVPSHVSLLRQPDAQTQSNGFSREFKTYAEEDNIIVTQLPLRETLVDFWALLWDYTCTALVMLNPRSWTRDGASRCGLFCAATFLCEQIRSEGLLDVSQAVRMLKRRRRQMIKDVEQYTFCYELALSYLDSFKIYGNFK
ncbi:Receptor-type tyrosine-protein phosphatase T, partial [Chelonia mydas]